MTDEVIPFRKKEETPEEDSSGMDFAEIMKKNTKNKEKVEGERRNHNKQIVKSHRLKK